jgi:UDP-glucose 4-epimerase
MKVLIIGAKGFIGSHCVAYFSKKHQVWQCDVVNDYVTENYSVIDATNADYSDVFQTQKFDVCINCSGGASVPDSLINPQRDFMLNTTNVFKQLDALKKFNPSCKYLNLSSAAVYGNPKYLPINEDHPLCPISPYGFHKKMSENICKEFYEVHGIATCSLRIFSVYGQGLKKQLFWDLHKKSLKTDTVNLFGTGEESRDFIFITDLLHAIDLIIQKSSFNNEIINVASGEELKIKEVVSIFYEQYNAKQKFEFKKDVRKGDPINWKADITILKNLGFKLEYSIKDGLKNYIEWIKELE